MMMMADAAMPNDINTHSSSSSSSRLLLNDTIVRATDASCLDDNLPARSAVRSIAIASCQHLHARRSSTSSDRLKSHRHRERDDEDDVNNRIPRKGRGRVEG